jgi:hypothetical protein
MDKPKHMISNWKQTVQSGPGTTWLSLTIRMNEQVIQRWHCYTHHGRRGRWFHYSYTAKVTALMLKGLYNLPLRAFERCSN